MEKMLKMWGQKGLGYRRIWKMLRENGIEVLESMVRYHYYKMFPERRGQRGRYIRCYNTDLRFLEYVRKLLSNLNIDTTGPHLYVKKGRPFFVKKLNKTYATNKDNYYIYIKADSRLKYYKLIGFTIKRKQQRLEDCLLKHGLPTTAVSQTSPSFYSITSLTN